MIVLPHIGAGSGADVYVRRLANGLTDLGLNVTTVQIPRRHEFLPWPMSGLSIPAEADTVIAPSNFAFALPGRHYKLITYEHHCVFDPAYRPYRSVKQAVFHELALRWYELASFRRADAVVAVSAYTAESLRTTLGVDDVTVITNGIETDFFVPREGGKPPRQGRRFRLLYVGNMLRRKGFDLLPQIMTELGDDFELLYTSGLRTSADDSPCANMFPLGRLSDEGLRDAYQNADLLLFPTRFEGFGYAAAEAMACGTPVVASDNSALPEVVQHGKTGLLCPTDDVGAFVSAIRGLSEDDSRRQEMGVAGAHIAQTNFGIRTMAETFKTLICRLRSGAGLSDRR